MRALCAWAESSSVPMLVIGGVAVSMLSKPRTTKDVDAVVWLPSPPAWDVFLREGEKFGIFPRISNALAFAHDARVLLVRHEPSSVPIDLSLGALPFEENAIRRAVRTEVGGLRVPLPVPDDLIVMKAVAHRARDIADIEAILGAHPEVDEKWVLSVVREFAEALEAPELMTDLVDVFRKRAPTKRTKKSRPRKR
jgi:predicted nucleotidyltransferase